MSSSEQPLHHIYQEPKLAVGITGAQGRWTYAFPRERSH